MNDRIDTRYFTRLERVTSSVQTQRGLLVDVDGEQLRVDVLRPDVVRLKISRGRVFDEEPTFAVCADLQAASPAFEVEEDEHAIRLHTEQLVLSIWKTPFHLEAHRVDGSTIFETAKDADGHYLAYATLNDAFVVGRCCGSADAFYGLGEKTGHFNRRGSDYTLWNTDVLNATAAAEFTAGKAPGDPRGDRRSTGFDPYYVSIPFFYHLAAVDNTIAGFFVDNGYRARFEFSHPAEYRYEFAGGQYTEYIFAGPRMDAILEGYTWLTGRMQRPPIWALGFHQCRWFRYTQAEMETLAEQHRAKDLPCDVLWLDIEYMRGYRVFTWDETRFPDAPAMLDRLTEQGFRTITIIDPGVKYEPGYWAFDQAVERDVLCRTEAGDIYIGQVWPGKTAFPDFVTPEARAWWGELNAAHVASGLAGLWNDMNEPATGDIQPGAMRFGKGHFSHARYHNQYALLMAMGTTEGLLQAMPDRRTFVLSRSGFAGIQRYAANWMGDNQSRWDHLWLSVPMALGFGVSGQPFVGADIGGFSGNTHAELFIRWMQCGVLTAFCRNHSELGTDEQYAWAFGDVVEKLVRQALHLRYRLMPYIYAAFVRASESGAPVQQPLIFGFGDDRTVRDIDDQYLFGSDLLVAPVYRRDTTARQVYLPAGSWYDWYSDERFAGNQFVVAPTPMDHIPLYARGGAVVPLWPDVPPSTAGYFPEVIELHVFVPAADGRDESVLYEDDGLSFAFRDGRYFQTTFTLTRQATHLALHATVQGQGYPAHRRRAFHIVFHGAMPMTVRVDGQTIVATDGVLVVTNAGTAFELDADLND